jgi:hypothetical protein
MPRNTLIAFSLGALLLISLPAMAKPAACGKRVQAFNEYEELGTDKKIVEKVSIFPVGEWSPDSAFEGLLVSAEEDPATKVEFETFKGKQKKRVMKRALAAHEWKERKDFRVVEDFKRGKDIFGGKYEAGSFVVRLTLNGKVLCEDGARNIAAGGD